MPGKFNKGDVSEGILAAAITARFLSKTKTVTNSDVMAIIGKLNKAKKEGSGVTSITTFKSPNAEKRIKDELICKVNLADINKKAFLGKTAYKDRDVKGIVTASVAYANGKYVQDWADMMYNNNQKNTIEVLSEGLLDQTGTKVDLKVRIDGKQAGVGISLKFGDVKQFGQVGGTKWESMLALFNPLGVRFTKANKDKYIDMLAAKKLAPALTEVYSNAAKQMAKKNKKAFAKSLSSFMVEHATRGEEDVVLVQLNRAEAHVYDFDVLEKKLTGHTVDVVLSSGRTDKLSTGGYKGGSSIPQIDFMIKDKLLVRIRLKLEGNRTNSKGKRLPLTVRSYVEKGPATTQLITG